MVLKGSHLWRPVELARHVLGTHFELSSSRNPSNKFMPGSILHDFMMIKGFKKMLTKSIPCHMLGSLPWHPLVILRPRRREWQLWGRSDALIPSPPDLNELVKSAWRAWGVDPTQVTKRDRQLRISQSFWTWLNHGLGFCRVSIVISRVTGLGSCEVSCFLTCGMIVLGAIF